MFTSFLACLNMPLKFTLFKLFFFNDLSFSQCARMRQEIQRVTLTAIMGFVTKPTHITTWWKRTVLENADFAEVLIGTWITRTLYVVNTHLNLWIAVTFSGLYWEVVAIQSLLWGRIMYKCLEYVVAIRGMTVSYLQALFCKKDLSLVDCGYSRLIF